LAVECERSPSCCSVAFCNKECQRLLQIEIARSRAAGVRQKEADSAKISRLLFSARLGSIEPDPLSARASAP
jgi:hypothetical protein